MMFLVNVKCWWRFAVDPTWSWVCVCVCVRSIFASTQIITNLKANLADRGIVLDTNYRAGGYFHPLELAHISTCEIKYDAHMNVRLTSAPLHLHFYPAPVFDPETNPSIFAFTLGRPRHRHHVDI